MRRLYLRIYLAVLVSLVAFALVAGAHWRHLGDGRGYAFQVAGVLAQNVLPPADAPAPEQQAALERLAANLRADVALFSADRTPLAAVGGRLPAPDPGRARGGWLRAWGPPAGVIQLRDGRWLVGRVRPEHRPTGAPLFFTLVFLALAVGVGAYPVVRRLTKRLERLQAGVESLGAGNLSARVRVEGRDEVARLAESFNRAAARIEELVGAHKSLLANASHELRTPLTRIRMAVELLKTDADRGRWWRRATTRTVDLERDIAELDALIEEILLASRLDAVATLDVDEDVDLLGLASEECARYEHAALEGRPVTVRGDPRLLRRMIRNLLENARRHGTPPIDVRVREADGAVELTVCDRGPGIPDAEREDVFRPFRPVGGPDASGGAGLGLALVRQIARRHGGDARYLGRIQARSCFVVNLPRVAGATRPASSPPPSPRS
ncbi:MAG TPA: HAMP domain-containing sensor histidine kinase [Candidatus Limnocylindria bacterium]|nr:HAMP domain-containing sensor histidine kinase [Candidatus Limnocylindria bacterium]